MRAVTTGIVHLSPWALVLLALFVIAVAGVCAFLCRRRGPRGRDGPVGFRALKGRDGIHGRHGKHTTATILLPHSDRFAAQIDVVRAVGGADMVYSLGYGAYATESGDVSVPSIARL